MASDFRVTPEELRAKAVQVEGWADQYQSLYNRINTAAEDLSSSFGGEAYQQYTVQLQEFQDDFKNLHTTISKYASYLKTTAQNYEQTEADVKAEAAGLSKGI